MLHKAEVELELALELPDARDVVAEIGQLLEVRDHVVNAEDFETSIIGSLRCPGIDVSRTRTRLNHFFAGDGFAP